MEEEQKIPEEVLKGKYGSKNHFQLIKQALLRIINRYYQRNASILVENKVLNLNVSLHSVHGRKDIYPDIYVELREKATEYQRPTKVIVVECETTANGLLRDKERLVSYKLLKIQNPKLHLYLAVPSLLKGKFTKPDFFNDVWYFDIE